MMIASVPSLELIPSEEILNPPQDSHLRKSYMLTATFNLIATIVGGGVLSMPLALAKSGLYLGTFLMVFAAVATDLSLYLLCSCARKTGATTFGAVARHAFGPGLELFTTVVLVAYLFLVLIGLMVLIRGIWAPIILWVISPELLFNKLAEDAVLMVAILVTMPLFLARDLHGLRHSCYASFASIFVLCGAMTYRALEQNAAYPSLYSKEVLYFTPSFADALYAYPLIALAFVSSFNVIEVQCALVDPTRERIQSAIHGAVFWSFLLMFVFALAGYLNEYDDTKGNILRNFDPTDRVILLGRIGCGICTLLAMPMSLLPCRNAMLALPLHYSIWREWKRQQRSMDEADDPYAEPSPPQFLSKQSTDQFVTLSPKHLAVIDDECISSRNKVIHRATTFGLVLLTYLGAVLAPGVAIVWSIVGSSLAFLVQYILPAACYIQLTKQQRHKRDPYRNAAWGLLVVSSIGAAACTLQTIWRIIFYEET